MWIKIHNKLLDWEWASCPETMALWIHILLRANYEDRRWQGITVPRGSFVTSVDSLASSTGLTVRQVRTSLNRLLATNEIERETTNRYTIITVCKYDEYQLNEDLIDKQTTSKRQTNDNQTTTTADIKNTRNKESISSDIDEKVSEIDDTAKTVTCKKKPQLDTSFVEPALTEIFQEFLNMRKKIGKPLKTQKGVNERYNKLISLSNGNTDLAIKIAEQTISHEWQDFYELKENRKPQQTQQQNYSNDNYWP